MQHKIKTGLTFLDIVKAAGAVGLVTLCGGLRRALREPGWIEKVEVSLPMTDLPPAWRGARIALLADLHVRPQEGTSRAAHIVEMTRACDSDLIILGGDVLVHGRWVDSLEGELAKLSAPLGVFAVLGNQDYPRPARLIKMLANAGIETLVNAHRILFRNGQPLCLAGLADLRWDRPDIQAALGEVAPAVPRILICHNPDIADDLPSDVRIDAMLSGHTHGGQVRLWGWGPAVLPIRDPRYAAGLVRGERFATYVSRGLGTAGLPLRFHCLPELTVLTLTHTGGEPKE